MFKGKSQKELIQVVKTIIQPLKLSFHKGQAGKIAVFGGCEDYTGAPFFLSYSAALVGADMSHIVCELLAAPIIKGYSPDLMVHPYLVDLSNATQKRWISEEAAEEVSKGQLTDVISQKNELDSVIDKHVFPKISSMIERVDLFVVGPGFGRDPLMLKTLVRIINEIKVVNKPVILDADLLFLLLVLPDIVKGYLKAVLTPNVVEFGRLCLALAIDNDDSLETAKRVLRKLGGVTLVKKGEQEVIVKNDTHLLNDFTGLPRRVGGQGDTLSGAIATMVTWAEHYNQEYWGNARQMEADELLVLACFGACSLVRTASNLAFRKYGRAMQTLNLHEFLGDAFKQLYEDELHL